MKYDVTKGGYILLGRCGENLARTVEIDVSEYLKEYPGAVVTLLHRRHGESGIYPVAVELRDGCLVWQPTSADTAIVGDGEAEVRVTVDGVLAKSKILSTMVDKSLTGQETDAPEPGMDWVDKIANAIDSVKNMKAEAESVAYGEPATAKYDGKTGTMHFDIPEGRPGRDGKDGTDGAPGVKGDKGDPGPKGDPGSDASVTAENIQSALGYAPVKDVQVAGTSILADGVANIKANAYQGVSFNSLHELVLFPAGADVLNPRVSNRAITPTNLDYAVKAAMCDGKGAAWTSAEQKAARSRMGVDKAYELIEEIVLEENTSVIERDAEPNGNSYEFTEMKILLTGMNSSRSDAYYAVTSNRLTKAVACVANVSGSNMGYKTLFEITCNEALTICRGTMYPGFNVIQAVMLNTLGISASTFWPSGNIEGFILRTQNAQNTAQLMAGTKIQIYGVRA